MLTPPYKSDTPTSGTCTPWWTRVETEPGQRQRDVRETGDVGEASRDRNLETSYLPFNKELTKLSAVLVRVGRPWTHSPRTGLPSPDSGPFRRSRPCPCLCPNRRQSRHGEGAPPARQSEDSESNGKHLAPAIIDGLDLHTRPVTFMYRLNFHESPINVFPSHALPSSPVCPTGTNWSSFGFTPRLFG